MEAPEWIWLQCDTPNHMAELLDLSTPPVAGAATAFAQYVALPQYREVAEDRAALVTRVAELEAALRAMLHRHELYCGGDGLPFAGHNDTKIHEMARAALEATHEEQ